MSKQKKQASSFKWLLLTGFFTGILICIIGIYYYVPKKEAKYIQEKSTPATLAKQTKKRVKRNKESNYLDTSSVFVDEDIEEFGADFFIDESIYEALLTEKNSDQNASDNTSLVLLEKETFFWDEPEERIAKEWLLELRKYRIPKSTHVSSMADSLLIEGIMKRNDLLLVEFWYSPMNYSGYRYLPGRLTLFGISQPEKANFTIIDKVLFLLYKNSSIALAETADFIPISYPKATSIQK